MLAPAPKHTRNRLVTLLAQGGEVVGFLSPHPVIGLVMDFKIELASTDTTLATVTINCGLAFGLPFGGGEIGAVDGPELLATELELLTPHQNFTKSLHIFPYTDQYKSALKFPREARSRHSPIKR